MTTSMAISKCLRFSKNIPLRSFIQFHLNPIATANSIQNVSESQLKLRPYETPSPNLLIRNDVAVAVRNQVDLAALSRGEMLARGRAVKIEEEFNEEDGEDFDDDSDEFEDEDDEMDGEDCDDDDDDDEDPVYKKRK